MASNFEKVQQEFFLGNGIKTKDKVKAMEDLLGRDHPRLLRFLREYGPGNLGGYFVPPIFFGCNPEVIKLEEYDLKTQGKGKHRAGVKGQIAEQVMFKALQEYFKKSKDDALVIHSHKFLNSATEKDFIIINVTKGYMMVIEVKANVQKFQKAKKQLFDAKTKIEEICSCINFGHGTKFLFAGVFFGLEKTSEQPLFLCNCPFSCSNFTIIGQENIEEALDLIGKRAVEIHAQQWNPSEHLGELMELAKQLMFIAQGDPKAPVTSTNMIDKICDQVDHATTFENIIFWTLQQLSVINVLNCPYIFLDAFYGTGKSFILQYIAQHWSNEIGNSNFFQNCLKDLRV